MILHQNWKNFEEYILSDSPLHHLFKCKRCGWHFIASEKGFRGRRRNAFYESYEEKIEVMEKHVLECRGRGIGAEIERDIHHEDV